MFKSITKRNLSILLVLVLALSVVMMTACTSTEEYKPNLTMPTDKTVSGNGQSAVVCGEYIYYVNGVETSTTADRTYDSSLPARVGNIVRIKTEYLDHIFSEIVDQDGKTSDTITEEVADYVRENAELVVTDYFYSGFSGSSTSTCNPGLYIFGDYIYYTTPNYFLDASGNKLSSQLLLKRCKLDGTEVSVMHTFTASDNSLKLVEINNIVYAMFVTSSEELYCANVSEKSADDTLVTSEACSATFDGNSVYYLDCEDTKIMCFTPGEEAKELVVEQPANDSIEYTYTIKSVNNGNVYYTYTADPSDYSATEAIVLYYTGKDATQSKVAFYTTDSDYCPTLFYKGQGVSVAKITSGAITVYGIKMYGDSTATKENTVTLLDPATNSDSITLNYIKDNYLYYTINSILYKQNLDDTNEERTIVADTLGTTATSWSIPCIAGNYVFTLSASSVSVVKFDSTEGKNVELTKGSNKGSDASANIIVLADDEEE